MRLEICSMLISSTISIPCWQIDTYIFKSCNGNSLAILIGSSYHSLQHIIHIVSLSPPTFSDHSLTELEDISTAHSTASNPKESSYQVSLLTKYWKNTLTILNVQGFQLDWKAVVFVLILTILIVKNLQMASHWVLLYMVHDTLRNIP